MKDRLRFLKQLKIELEKEVVQDEEKFSRQEKVKSYIDQKDYQRIFNDMDLLTPTFLAPLSAQWEEVLAEFRKAAMSVDGFKEIAEKSAGKYGEVLAHVQQHGSSTQKKQYTDFPKKIRDAIYRYAKKQIPLQQKITALIEDLVRLACADLLDSSSNLRPEIVEVLGIQNVASEKQVIRCVLYSYVLVVAQQVGFLLANPENKKIRDTAVVSVLENMIQERLRDVSLNKHMILNRPQQLARMLAVKLDEGQDQQDIIFALKMQMQADFNACITAEKKEDQKKNKAQKESFWQDVLLEYGIVHVASLPELFLELQKLLEQNRVKGNQETLINKLVSVVSGIYKNFDKEGKGKPQQGDSEEKLIDWEQVIRLRDIVFAVDAVDLAYCDPEKVLTFFKQTSSGWPPVDKRPKIEQEVLMFLKDLVNGPELLLKNEVTAVDVMVAAKLLLAGDHAKGVLGDIIEKKLKQLLPSSQKEIKEIPRQAKEIVQMFKAVQQQKVALIP